MLSPARSKHCVKPCLTIVGQDAHMNLVRLSSLALTLSCALTNTTGPENCGTVSTPSTIGLFLDLLIRSRRRRRNDRCPFVRALSDLFARKGVAMADTRLDWNHEENSGTRRSDCDALNLSYRSQKMHNRLEFPLTRFSSRRSLRVLLVSRI